MGETLLQVRARVAGLDGTAVRMLGLLALATLAASMPLLFLDSIPLTDYPNHLARIYIHDNLDRIPELARYYHRAGGFDPYITSPLVNLLQGLFDLETAGKVYIVLCLAVAMAGVIVLNTVLNGRVSLLPLLALPFLYGLVLAFGFVTFMLGAGLALTGLALWIRTEGKDIRLRTAMGLAVCLAVSVAHLLAGGFYALLLAGYEAGRLRAASRAAWPREIRARAFGVLQFLPILALFLLADSSDVAAGGEAFAFGGVGERIRALIAPFAVTLNLYDIGASFGLLIVLVLLIRRRFLGVDSRMVGVLLLLLLVALFFPSKLFGVKVLEIRFPFCLALAFIAGLRAMRPPSPREFLFLGAAAVLIAVKLSTVSGLLAAGGERVDRMRAAAASVIEPGARVLPVFNLQRTSGFTDLQNFSFYHATAYLVLERNIFYPLLFSVYEVGVNDAWRDSSQRIATMPASLHKLRDFAKGENLDTYDEERDAYWRGWPEKFDYLVVFDPGADVAVDLSELGNLERVHDGGYFQILRVRE